MKDGAEEEEMTFWSPYKKCTWAKLSCWFHTKQFLSPHWKAKIVFQIYNSRRSTRTWKLSLQGKSSRQRFKQCALRDIFMSCCLRQNPSDCVVPHPHASPCEEPVQGWRLLSSHRRSPIRANPEAPWGFCRAQIHIGRPFHFIDRSMPQPQRLLALLSQRLPLMSSATYKQIAW